MSEIFENESDLLAEANAMDYESSNTAGSTNDQPPTMNEDDSREVSHPRNRMMQAITTGMNLMGHPVNDAPQGISRTSDEFERRENNNIPSTSSMPEPSANLANASRAERFVQPFNESFSEEHPSEEVSSTGDGYNLSHIQARAKREKQEKEKQEKLFKTVYDGCGPRDFSNAISGLELILKVTRRDAVADTFIKDVKQILQDLDVVSRTLKQEFCPFSMGGYSFLTELILCKASNRMIEVMLRLPENHPAGRWRFEVSMVRNMTNANTEPICVKFFQTSRMYFSNTADYFCRKSKNFATEWLVKKYVQQLERNFEHSGVKGLVFPEIRESLVNHPTYGEDIARVGEIWKNLRRQFHSAKAELKKLADKPLTELVKLSEKESTAAKLSCLFGSEAVRDHQVVCLTPSGTLKCFKLDGKKVAQETRLPNWCHDHHVTLERNIQSFGRKRYPRDEGGNRDSKKRRMNSSSNNN